MNGDRERSRGFWDVPFGRRARRGTSMLLSGVAALVLNGAFPASASAQQTSAAPSLVFDGVTVVDVETGKLVPHQRVVIAGNQIQAMGRTRSVALPKGAQVVQARGKYLIPGLIGMAGLDPAEERDG